MRQAEQQPVRFVTVSTQRSGSTWLTDLLNSHPDIASYTELLLLQGRGIPDWGRYKDMTYWQTWREDLRGTARYVRPLGLFRYLDEALSRHADRQAVGLKLMYSQIVHFPETLLYLRRRQVRIIHLVRRNVLDVVLSGLAKSSRKVAHAQAGASVEQVRLQVDTAWLLRQLSRRWRDQRWFGRLLPRLGVPCAELVYEDIVAEPARLDDCVRFLGCAPAPLGSGLTKLNPRSHADLIGNLEEVQATLRGTPFAGMLRV
ncbi:MAG: sulfotransferase [Pseudomonadota bacterium]